MDVSELFRRHLLLAARLQAGKPLSRGEEAPSAADLEELIEKAEGRPKFISGRTSAQARGVFEPAEFAVNAIIDQAARSKFKQQWNARNPDSIVGATFYRNLLERRKLPKAQNGQDEVQSLYVLCILLGHQGDHNLRESAEVKQATHDVVKISAASRFKPSFAALPEHFHDGDIRGAYLWARRTFCLMTFVFIAAAVLIWIAWLSFPKVYGQA